MAVLEWNGIQDGAHRMIITQTPLRISFAGGGTDFADFYRAEGGCVVSSAIDKYIFVIVKERFDKKIRVGYSRTEITETLDELQHELVREAMRKVGVKPGIEISTMADIPSEGSGLGSSSSVTVGLLNAFCAYEGEIAPAAALAEGACEIEIGVLGKPIGKQDQYIAAFGGLRCFEFRQDDTVEVSSIHLSDDACRELSDQLFLFYTGVTRQASSILSEQKQNIADRIEVLRAMRDQARQLKKDLESGDLDAIGHALREGWELKKKLAGKISNPEIDEMHDAAIYAGALGAKVAGAGGGGFLMVYCPRARVNALRRALSGLRELPFALERDGTKVIFNVRR